MLCDFFQSKSALKNVIFYIFFEKMLQLELLALGHLSTKQRTSLNEFKLLIVSKYRFIAVQAKRKKTRDARWPAGGFAGRDFFKKFFAGRDCGIFKSLRAGSRGIL